MRKSKHSLMVSPKVLEVEKLSEEKRQRLLKIITGNSEEINKLKIDFENLDERSKIKFKNLDKKLIRLDEKLIKVESSLAI